MVNRSTFRTPARLPRRGAAVLVALTLLLAVLAGCGSGKKKANTTGATGSRPASKTDTDAGHSHTRAPGVPCQGQWQYVPSPPLGPKTTLLGAAVTSRTNAWAVGGAVGQTNGAMAIEHWDGKAWTVAWRGPVGVLYSIKVISADDIWASGKADEHAYAVHWDGHSWTGRTIDGGPLRTLLIEVAPVGPNDVWGAGLRLDVPQAAFLVHWDGKSWSDNQSPVADSAVLRSSSVAPGGTVWAVGETIEDDHSALVERLIPGSGWSVVPTGFTSKASVSLHGVVPVAANDVWAIGFQLVNHVNQGFGLHFDGKTWTKIDMPTVAEGARPRHAAALSANDVWATGDAGDSGSLLMHWDGKAWSRVPPIDAGRSFGIAASPMSDEVWVVGEKVTAVPGQTDVDHNGPLILHLVCS